MENPIAPSPLAQDRPTSAFGASGIWSLDGDRLVRIAELADGDRAVVLVRSEDVLLLPVALPPLSSAQRRRDALPFAVEDHIAAPIDEVHVALGEQTEPGIWLAAVVSHAVMAQWIDRLARAGLERARLVPDTLCLPVPDPGHWSVDLAGDRALVRLSDGSGFAVPQELLNAAWHTAGEPACIACGVPLPPQFAAEMARSDTDALSARLRMPALDLRQGRYAAPRTLINPAWKRIALVAGIGVMAHGAIAIADTIALSHLAHQRVAQVRAMGAGLQPPVAIGDNLGDTITALTPDPAAGGSSRFMALLSRSAAALAAPKPADTAQPGVAPGPAWRSVSFDGAAGTLTIEVETDNIADLQRMAQALTSAGLSAQPGSATTQGGKAVGSFVVRAL